MKPERNEILNFLDFIIKEKDKKSIDSYILIREAISTYSIPFPSISIPKGKLLYRTRVHEEGECFYKRISDLSHIQDLSCIKSFGRANEPLQSIFYCSDNSNVAFFETSKLLKKKEKRDYEILTTGIWQVQEEIRVGNIPINETIKGINVTADGLQDCLDKVISKYDISDKDLYFKVLDIFSREFTRDAKNDESNYWISCAFANYIFNTFGHDTILNKDIKASGILYTSVIHREEGMNLALKPILVEDGKLSLINAVRKVMVRTNENSYKECEELKSKKIDWETGEIIWE